MEPLVSVIVPVYNAVQFLGQCLDSIVAQSYGHLEIIVVDDGSDDGSGELSDQWAARDSRIRVIHQPNGGHSAARNTALDVMRGDLVMMVDSDDIVHPQFVTTLLDVMQHSHADIAVGGYVPFYGPESPHFKPTSGTPSFQTLTQEEAILAVFYQHGLTHSPWGRLFKASLFKDIRFPLGIIYEDLAIIYPLLKQCQCVAVTGTVLYGYRQHANNSMRVFSHRRTAVLDVCENLEQTMQAQAPQYLRAVRSRLLSAYFNMLLLCNQHDRDEYRQVDERCWTGIKRLRWNCLLDKSVRLKNKLGILVSYCGHWFLCDVMGRRFKPQP